MPPHEQGKGDKARPASTQPAALVKMADSIKSLHKKMDKPKSGEWLASHKEAGQSFAQYLRSNPVTPRGKRRVIYVRPLGSFEGASQKIIDKTSAFLRAYFNLKVTVLPTMPLSKIPDTAKRVHPTWGDKQILSTYVLDKVLAEALPEDAMALICFTSSDLWPGQGWNFVFGQASLHRRVGVWSIYRNGDPQKSKALFRLCLLRTLKTATHELGHMFSIRHCTAYNCNMCGSNHRQESDRRPLALCPECLPKILWATASDAATRAARLEAWCRTEGLLQEADYYKAFTTLLAQKKGRNK